MQNLQKYKISEFSAFVLENPLEYLPPYYEAWNYNAKNIMTLISRGTVRNTLEQIPVLDVDSIADDHEATRLAHLQLSTLISAYIWCNGDDHVPRVMPQSLSVPFWKTCQILGVTPGIAAHLSLALANYKLKDPKEELRVENMDMLYFKFVEDYDNDWFFLLTTQLELEFAKGLPTLLNVLKSAKSKNLVQLENGLNSLSGTITAMDLTLRRMPEHLNADKFFYGFRPFMAGTVGGRYDQWGGIVPENVTEKPVKMTGGSAAQSGSLQCLDACLNIVHDGTARHYLQDIRDNILPEHKKFIEDVESESLVRSTVSLANSNSLSEAYDECVKSLLALRNHHIQTVSRFIVSPRAKGRQFLDEKLKNCEQIISPNYATLNDVGTGGTGIMPFLKSVRDTTAKHLFHQ